ncbi:MAG: UDP-N-acetylmuramate--L-alanine ligase [Anaerolineae bacterium]|nr:UDP-N-acetylmuramate--L-alanine ligase [Anaerolineae bacterium]
MSQSETFPNPNLLGKPGQRVHVVGVGGAGMSAIARVLIGRGLYVSGSDRSTGAAAQALAALGATVYEGHAAAHVAESAPDVLLISSAVGPDNPEVAAARAAHIPILKRRDALPLLLRGCRQLAVAGTHGKTTTTAMLAHILRDAGRDPSYIVGGVMLNTGDNAHAGAGDAFVIEADEYDYMFLGLHPAIAILTNVEHDHPDMFPTLEDVHAAFRRFLGQIVAPDGLLIACGDDPGARALAVERRNAGGAVLLYGLDSPALDWTGQRGVEPGAFTARGALDGRPVAQPVRLALAGDHNLRNALAAFAAACASGITPGAAAGALAAFKGAGRRAEIMGSVGGVIVVSDYGHHPTAIRATLQAMRQQHPGRAVWAVWQPHTFSRTRTLAAEFALAFADADHVLVTDIYAAREQFQPGDLDGAAMAGRIAASGHPDARHSGGLEHTARLLVDHLAGARGPGAVVVIFSAGDAPQVGEMLLAALHKVR